MADVFISYKREEREKARAVAELLVQAGYTVWWDIDLLSGDKFAKEIESVIRNAKAAIVLWSKLSVVSHWVLEEAELARSLDIMLPVLLDGTDPPFGYRNLNAQDLSSWTGNADAPELVHLLQAVRKKAGPPSGQKLNSRGAVEDAVSAFQVEAAYWASITQLPVQRASEYQAYLDRFGETAQFADLARARIASLATMPRPGVIRPFVKYAGGGLTAAAALATIFVALQTGLPTPTLTSTPAPTPSMVASPTPTPAPNPTTQPDKTFKVGAVFQDALRGGGKGPQMVVVPAGRFVMGSPASEAGRQKDEGPARTVTISKAFAVGKFEVTWAEWGACVAAGGCDNAGPFSKGEDEGWGKGSRPVINVSWNDAKAYVSWLSSETGARYRLLSEAEWEYAARAGTSSAYWWGNSASHEYANYGKDFCCAGLASGRDEWVNTSPVGSFPANGFGLYDMHGNVWEWVEDCYQNSYSGLPVDGTAKTTQGCSGRVSRGGSWIYVPLRLRSANRIRYVPSDRDNDLGFRVARTL